MWARRLGDPGNGAGTGGKEAGARCMAGSTGCAIGNVACVLDGVEAVRFGKNMPYVGAFGCMTLRRGGARPNNCDVLSWAFWVMRAIAASTPASRL